ncbi:THO complex subunit 6 [Phytophthora pseudosyringae]|uniref:THO complex subunit 6 n=1 Tax=Phytophthora pseudosyringae TaxID=221518 RepID=A0A8T1VDV2_9STRA|nr:THO complex subunit 6 [Phytophthora pseudosyringae]
MDPAAYDEDAFRAELLRKMRASEAVVYQAVFAPEKVSGGETVLVAATSSGLLHVYQLGQLMKPAYWDQVARGEATAFPGPDLSFQAHPTQIYSLRFAGDETDPLLISGGDQDFRVWKWKHIVAAMEDPAVARNLKPVHIDHLKRRTLGFRGALLPATEVNDVAVSKTSGHLFLAGGDSVAHEWDVATQQFTRQFEGHEDYLHAVRHLQHSQELVTGSEDGTLGIWDVRQDKKVEFLRPQSATESTSSPPPSLWVGAVAHDESEMWLACGGGSKRSPGGRSHQTEATGGFLGMWHLPSRVPVHYTKTTSDVHDVVFHHMELLSVGNDAGLKKWNRSSGQLLAAARSTLPSCHFCVVDQATDVIAVGGAAPSIDIYTMPGVVSFSLVVEDESSSGALP